MRAIATLVAAGLLSVGSLRAADVDVGAVDQKAPKTEDLAAPKKDDGVPTVELKAAVRGRVAKGEKRPVYVVVGPLGKKGEAAGGWWVPGEVTRGGEKVTGEAQFGEGELGVGEYFAVVAVATDKKWEVGEKLDALPADAAFSKATVVKRK